MTYDNLIACGPIQRSSVKATFLPAAASSGPQLPTQTRLQTGGQALGQTDKAGGSALTALIKLRQPVRH